jgi:hypothetical protein
MYRSDTLSVVPNAGNVIEAHEHKEILESGKVSEPIRGPLMVF